MASRSKSIDENQLNLDFSKVVDRFVDTKEDIEGKLEQREEERFKKLECEFEICIEIAAAVKKAQRESGLSRELLVDGINDYFGRSKEAHKAKLCRKPLSLDMLNHHLSKPAEYPIDAYLLVAICAVTASLTPLNPFVEPFGGRVATGIELEQMELGRLEQTMAEMQRIKKRLKKG